MRVVSASTPRLLPASCSALSLCVLLLLTLSSHVSQSSAFGVGTVLPSFRCPSSSARPSFRPSALQSLSSAVAPPSSSYSTVAAPAVKEAPTACAVTFVAETNLPTALGDFRLRAYRVGATSYNPSSSFTPVIRYEPVVVYKLPPSSASATAASSSASSSTSSSSTSSSPQPTKSRRVFGDSVSAAFGPSGVPVRVHDQCFTSEVFGSLRCDCRSQLLQSLKSIQKSGGAVVYLQQEGRGIGLANKIHAYSLQDGGMDTVDANLHLGFGEDERSYDCVPAILDDLGIEAVQLLTNNPYKINALKSLGVKVSSVNECVGEGGANVHNRKYLETKVEKMGHREAVRNQLQSLALSSSVSAGGLSDEGVVAASDGYCFGKQSVVDCIAAIGRGELVVVVDDMDRENEGDFILSASLATKETIADMIKYTSGVLCVAADGERLDALKLPAMVEKNEDQKQTAFTVSVDATKKHGISTGISAADRAKTCNLLAAPLGKGAPGSVDAKDFNRPGHIFPLRAREGGVLTRDGHTEATVDLCRLAGLPAVGVLCEIVSERNVGEMARLPELRAFAKEKGYVLTSIADLIAYRKELKV